jgi:predicted transcriptional regulator
MLDPVFLAAIGHPVRFEALVLFERAPTSTRELAARVGLSPGATAHHVKELERAGLIAVAETRRRGRRDERFWRTRTTGWAELEAVLTQAAERVARAADGS